MLNLSCAVETDKGLHHKKNEDCWYANAERGLYFVTDGMANEVTPHFIMETLPGMVYEKFAAVDDVTAPAAADAMRDVLRALNADVAAHRLDLWTDRGGVGATLVLVLARADHALIAHLGDSRVYLHAKGILAPMTTDHSTVQQLLDEGAITAAEAIGARSAGGGPTQFIGMSGVARADICVYAFAAGERLLLCTDGLTDMLLDDEILAILEKHAAMDTACKQLIAAANAAGGRDNITAMLLGPT
jgi:PPM family protein phosphatase